MAMRELHWRAVPRSPAVHTDCLQHCTEVSGSPVAFVVLVGVVDTSVDVVVAVAAAVVAADTRAAACYLVQG